MTGQHGGKIADGRIAFLVALSGTQCCCGETLRLGRSGALTCALPLPAAVAGDGETWRLGVPRSFKLTCALPLSGESLLLSRSPETA